QPQTPSAPKLTKTRKIQCCPSRDIACASPEIGRLGRAQSRKKDGAARSVSGRGPDHQRGQILPPFAGPRSPAFVPGPWSSLEPPYLRRTPESSLCREVRSARWVRGRSGAQNGSSPSELGLEPSGGGRGQRNGPSLEGVLGVGSTPCARACCFRAET